MKEKDTFEESKPNKTVIEMESVNKLKSALNRTQLMVPAIPDTDDKVPSWDGEIRLYSSSENFSKNTILERIPVQVKGTWISHFSGKKATFQADTSDLNNYLNDGGVMFFLIEMKDFDSYRIYYASLLPFDLRRLLDNAKGKKTKSVKLEVFPHKHIDGMRRIFEEYRLNKKKQGTLLPDIRSMSDLEASNIEVEKLEITVPVVDAESQNDLYDELLRHPQYVYAKPKNMEISFPVDKISPQKIVFHRNNNVVVDGEVLYHYIDTERLPDGNEQIRLGNNITITKNFDGSLELNCKFNGTLQEQISEIKLMIALLRKQNVHIGDRLLMPTNVDFHGHTLEDALERQDELLRVDAALKKLHVEKDFNLGSLSEKETRELNYLVSGILDGIPVPFNLSKESPVGRLTLGNITVLLDSRVNPDGPGVFIHNFFEAKDIRLTPIGEKPEKGYRISPYVLLSVDSFRLLDNVCLSKVVPSIKSVPYSDVYGGRITLFILELLKWFDEKKNPDVLDIVIELLDFLQENDSTQPELYQINRLQTEKRRRSFSKEEIQYLMSLKTSGIPLQYQLAADILLGSFQEAQVVYDRLEESEREIFDTYPISNLWLR